ncbi:MAG: hypothetical protein L0G27_08205, partial [Paracoccus sp. (in: a-proteobacteria)]|nr:hypothetical protein [Paracoccus sp. (in: a-proteobacteria)]
RGLNRKLGNPGIGPGAGVALCDPMVASPYSPMPQIMVSSATLVAPNGIGLRAVNGGYINCLYMVPLWARVGFEAVNGGILDLTYCSLQFGDYCLRREGFRRVGNPPRSTVLPAPDEAAANAIVAAKADIVNALWSALVAGGYGSLKEATTRLDGGLFVDAIANSVRAGDDEPVRWFGRRLFRFDGTPVFTPTSRPGFILGWEVMRNRITSIGAVSGIADAITARTQILITPGNTSPLRVSPSEMNANDFVFRKVGTGVDFGAIERTPLPITDTFIDRGPGQINWNGVEQDTGRQFFTGGALVNPLTGQFEGPPVKRTFDPIAAEAALIVGGQF